MMNKTALITGGSRGIGLAVVKAILNENYDCIIVSRNISDEVVELEKSGHVSFIKADISSSVDRELIKHKIFSLEKLDLLVNCAGVAPKVRKDMLEITEEDFDFVLDINQKGTFFISQAAATKMIQQNSGRIVFITSLSSYTASVERAEYCISKASISMFTKLFAARLAECGVYVFEVSPGIIETDMTKCVKEKYDKLISDGITPVRRMGQPEDVARAVLCCASGNLDFCTGSVINVDGGFSVRRL